MTCFFDIGTELGYKVSRSGGGERHAGEESAASFTVQFLKCFGAYPIVAVDVLAEKLGAAKRFGATYTVDASKDDPVAATKSITDGGADKSFECIGNVKTADQIVNATCPGGTAVIVGGLGHKAHYFGRRAKGIIRLDNT